MAEDRLSEVLEQVTDKFIAAEMLQHIEKAWPNVVEDKALREACAEYIDNAPEDKKFKRASSLIKISAVANPKKQDDGFEDFLTANFAGVPLDEETINGLRQSYNEMYGISNAQTVAEDNYKRQDLYKDLNVVINDTLPNIEYMAEQSLQADASMMKKAEQGADIEKIPEWSIVNDQNGSKYAATIFNNEYPPRASNEAEAVAAVDDIKRTISAEGLKGCLDAILQKSEMAEIAMTVLGEMHPQFKNADVSMYREQVKIYPNIAVVGLLRAQTEGKTISSPQQLNEIINEPTNIVLGMQLTQQSIDVSNRKNIEQFVQKNMAMEAFQQNKMQQAGGILR